MKQLGRSKRLTLSIVGIVLLCLAAYYPVLGERYADFRAFYCAGQTVRAHADPYREHPLRECEHSVAAPGASAVINDITIPAPLPGYALALFAVIAILPFGMAVLLCLCASTAALVLTVVLVTRFMRLPGVVAAIVIGFPSAILAIELGQVTPFIGLAMMATATLLAAGKPRSAALAALPIALEPHVALPILLALLIGAPKTRGMLVIGGIGLGALSIAVLGVNLNLEYIRDVLPAHALANIPDLSQLSAAHFAYVLGVPLAAARTIGSVWYAAATLLGIAVALVLRSRFGLAGLVLIPPAFALFGGLHVHSTQLLLGIPAFLLVFANAARGRLALAILIFLAATPWLKVANYSMLIPGVAVLAAVFARRVTTMRSSIWLAVGAALIGVVLAKTSFIGVADHPPPRVAVHTTGNPLADDSWSVAMLQHDGYAPIQWFMAAKAPTLLAYFILLCALVRVAARELADRCRPLTRRTLALPPRAIASQA